MEKAYINIRNRRLELGMTQKELAEKCGYKDHTTINKLESGQVDASLGRLRQIAGILGLSLKQLLGLDEEDD